MRAECGGASSSGSPSSDFRELFDAPRGFLCVWAFLLELGCWEGLSEVTLCWGAVISKLGGLHKDGSRLFD